MTISVAQILIILILMILLFGNLPNIFKDISRLIKHVNKLKK